jgi:enoyl-CoA hydratase/carnithine racemase
MTEDLLVERRGAVLWITFNRPQVRNAMNDDMMHRLVEVCAGVQTDRSVRAVVFTGAGDRAFAAGADIAKFRNLRTPEQVLAQGGGETLMRSIESVRVPTIAAINGACTGGGAGVATCCDLRIATSSVRFGYPIARTLGNALSMENYTRLAAIVGGPRARDLLLTARLLPAGELLAAGIVSEVLPDQAALLARTRELAEEVASLAPLTLQVTKEALHRVRDRMVPEDPEARLLLTAYLSRDFQEGVDAFLNKRQPRWTGE